MITKVITYGFLADNRGQLTDGTMSSDPDFRAPAVEFEHLRGGIFMKSRLHTNMAFVLLVLSSVITNCGSTSSSGDANNSLAANDSSASGAAAGAVGGALSSSSSGGTQARLLNFPLPQSRYAALRSEMSLLPKALAEAFCPTFKSLDNRCSVSGAEMWLSYNDCTFSGRASWNGVQAITMSSGAAACGSFPNPGNSGVLNRQYVQAAGGNAPGSVTLTAEDTTGTVDDASANLANFDNDSIATMINGGYGAEVNFAANGTRNGLALGHHISVSGVFDHSVTTGSQPLTISESVGATSRTVNGQVLVYHNLLKVIGTSTFVNVVHDDVCCLPVSGSITTVFSAGANVSPTLAGQKYIGQSEVLTFTGCGTASYQNINGVTTSVALNRCF